jgi:para-aminobenzoate synthetase component 1
MREKFARVQAYLQSGDCYQVNLAQRFQATYQGDEWQAFTRLNASNKAPFSVCSGTWRDFKPVA